MNYAYKSQQTEFNLLQNRSSLWWIVDLLKQFWANASWTENISRHQLAGFSYSMDSMELQPFSDFAELSVMSLKIDWLTNFQELSGTFRNFQKISGTFSEKHDFYVKRLQAYKIIIGKLARKFC